MTRESVARESRRGYILSEVDCQKFDVQRFRQKGFLHQAQTTLECNALETLAQHRELLSVKLRKHRAHGNKEGNLGRRETELPFPVRSFPLDLRRNRSSCTRSRR